MNLAEPLVGLLPHVRRPPKAGLDRSEADRERADPDDVHRQPMKLADLVGCVEALVLDAAHLPERVTVLARSVKVEAERSCMPPATMNVVATAMASARRPLGSVSLERVRPRRGGAGVVGDCDVEVLRPRLGVCRDRDRD